MSPLTFEQWLQSRLTAHGYPVGEIDGVMSEVTVRALKAFQTRFGLVADGRAGEQTIAALRAPSSAVLPVIMTDLPDRDAPAAPTPPASIAIWPRQDDVPAFFGAVGTDQTTIEIPYEMVLAWDTGTRVKRMTLHRKVADSALRVLQKTAGLYSAAERADLGLNLFGGSLNVRRMRGGSRYSMHSWGIAIDFDPQRNQLHWHRPQARLSHEDAVPFWRAWEAEGWVSLGRARDYDHMHVQAARL